MSLRIQALGPFRVFRGDAPIPESAWKTQKNKTLLKILLTYRQRRLTRDQLLDWLWPDLDPDAADRSLRAVFDRSWDLLSADERAALRSLSVFRGGFLREAAVRVAGVSPAVLAALAAQSLLRAGPTGRYELHELVRQYVAEKLAEQPADKDRLRGRHCTA